MSSTSSLPAITRSTAASVTQSLSSLSSSVGASVSTFFHRPVPLWLALLTSLTSVLALHLTSRFSRRAPLPASMFCFPASLRLSRLHFRHGWLQFDQQRTGTLQAEEAAALVQQLLTQVATNQRLQQQYALELLVAATAAASHTQSHTAPAAERQQPPGWLLAEATEAVRVVFDKLNGGCDDVFATFVDQLQAGQITTAVTAASSQPASRGGKEEKIEAQKRQVVNEMEGELNAVSTVTEVEDPVYSMDYRSLCLLYSGYVESQLAVYFTRHFRLT